MLVQSECQDARENTCDYDVYAYHAMPATGSSADSPPDRVPKQLPRGRSQTDFGSHLWREKELAGQPLTPGMDAALCYFSPSKRRRWRWSVRCHAAIWDAAKADHPLRPDNRNISRIWYLTASSGSRRRIGVMPAPSGQPLPDSADRLSVAPGLDRGLPAA